MDFWGFEGRKEMPGDGFGLFGGAGQVAPATATPVPAATTPAAAPSASNNNVLDLIINPLGVGKNSTQQAADNTNVKGKPTTKANRNQQTGKSGAKPKAGAKPIDPYSDIEQHPVDAAREAKADHVSAEAAPKAGAKTATPDWALFPSGDGARPEYKELNDEVSSSSYANFLAGFNDGKAPQTYQEFHDLSQKVMREHGDDPQAKSALASLKKVDADYQSRARSLEKSGTAAKIEKIANTVTTASTAASEAFCALGKMGVSSRFAGAALGLSPACVDYGAIGGFGGFGGIGGFGGCGGELLTTESACGTLSYGDLTGTGFAIQSMGGSARMKGNKIEAMINQLLAMIASGNVDAITSALNLCTQKARMTLSEVAAQVVKAMQVYDKQTEKLSEKMASLSGKGNSSETAGQLSSLNTQASQISSTRQMMTEFLRTVMGMLEELGNINKGVGDTMARINSTQSRFA